MSHDFNVRDEFADIEEHRTGGEENTQSESEFEDLTDVDSYEEEGFEEKCDDMDEDLELSDTDEEDKEEGRTSDVKNSNTQSVIEDLTNVEVDSSENVQNLVTENNNKLKLSWNGEELFPPQGSRGPKTSKAWKHGGFKKDNKGNLIKDMVWCSYCGKSLKFLGSPSNLMDHINSRHMDIVIKQEDKDKNNQPKMTDMFNKKFSKVEKYKLSHPKQAALKNNLYNWIVKDKRPLQIVEDTFFQKIIEDIDPKLSVPSRRTITRIIRGSYNEKKKQQIEKFKVPEFFSCTNDGGTSLANHGFIAINLHWIDENFEARKKVIDMMPVDSKKADSYRQDVDKSLEEHKVKDKTFSFTTDNENTMKKSFKKTERIGCFAHIESKACQTSLDSTKILRRVRRKLRTVAKKSNKSPKFKRNITLEQNKRKIPSRVLKQEVATRFTSTKDMFASFAPSKPKEEVDSEVVHKNIDAINAALKECFKQKEVESLKITKKDVDVVLNILPLLEILEEGIARIGGEKYSTGSIVLPFLSKFLDHLEGDEDDLMYVQFFKNKLQSELITRCKENLNFVILAKSSFCDMRYSHLKFLKVLRKFKVTTITKEMITDLVKSELEVVESNIDTEEKNEKLEPKRKKKKKSFLDDGEEDEFHHRPASVELEEYMKEPSIKAAKCPGNIIVLY